MKNNLWGTAFKKKPSSEVLAYCAGWDTKEFPALDSLLLPYELEVNAAHAQMLCEQGIISHHELAALKKALAAASKLASKNAFPLDGFEDSHSAVEAFVTKRTPAGLKLHSGRSRNDLVATSTRLLLKAKAKAFAISLMQLAAALKSAAAKHAGVPMPGFSHHRIAMPFTWGKWLESYAVAFKRDAKSFEAFIALYDECPLGAAAGFGTSFPISSASTAKKLGFAKPFANSLDAVQQRWEAEAAFVFCLAKAMNHLSQLSESLIVLSMDGLELVHLPLEFCTGSSIMPHKKNPDFLEATKAKASIVAACLQQLVDAGKSSFTGYNRDSQWTKKSLLHAFAECEKAPALMADFVGKAAPNVEKLASMCELAQAGQAAEKLALKHGLPFRSAKQAAEKKLGQAFGKQ